MSAVTTHPSRTSSAASPPCADVDRSLFFPKKGTPLAAIRRAQQVCEPCPIKDACLEYGLDNRLPGIWGGTTGAERRRLLTDGEVTELGEVA